MHEERKYKEKGPELGRARVEKKINEKSTLVIYRKCKVRICEEKFYNIYASVLIV